MICPRDNTVMRTESLYQTHIDVCPTCLGIWFDKDELRFVLSKFSFDTKENTQELVQKWFTIGQESVTLPRDFWQEDTLVCPLDGVSLSKHYFAGTKIGVDQCRLCEGFWIDGSEFKAMWEQVIPDPLYDTMGKAFIAEMQRIEKEREDIKQIPARIQYTISSLVLNPAYGLYLLGSILAKLIIEEFQSSKK